METSPHMSDSERMRMMWAMKNKQNQTIRADFGVKGKMKGWYMFVILVEVIAKSSMENQTFRPGSQYLSQSIDFSRGGDLNQSFSRFSKPSLDYSIQNYDALNSSIQINDHYYDNLEGPTPSFNVKKNVIAADHMKGRVPMDYHQDVQIPPSSSSARMQVPQTYALKSNSSAGYHPNANMRGYNSNSQMTTHM